jgi:hypothetical protein
MQHWSPSVSSPGTGRLDLDSLSVAVTGTGSLGRMVTFDPTSETAVYLSYDWVSEGGMKFKNVEIRLQK